MLTESELVTQIEAIEAKLRAAVRSTSVDGTTVQIDLQVMRDERNRLVTELNRIRGRRPRSARIYLGGF